MHFKLYMQEGLWYTLPRYDVSHTFEQYTVFNWCIQCVNCIYLPPPIFLYLKNIGTLCGFQWTLSQCYDSLSIFQFSEIDLSQLLYSFWRVGIIMSKLKNKLCIKLIYICSIGIQLYKYYDSLSIFQFSERDIMPQFF